MAGSILNRNDEQMDKLASQCVYLALRYASENYSALMQDVLSSSLEAHEHAVKSLCPQTWSRCVNIVRERCNWMEKQLKHVVPLNEFTDFREALKTTKNTPHNMRNAIASDMCKAVFQKGSIEDRWPQVLLGILVTSRCADTLLYQMDASEKKTDRTVHLVEAIFDGFSKSLVASKYELKTLKTWKCFVQKYGTANLYHSPNEHCTIAAKNPTGLDFLPEGEEYAIFILEKGLCQDLSRFSGLHPSIRKFYKSKYLIMSRIAYETELNEENVHNFFAQFVCYDEKFEDDSDENSYQTAFLDLLSTNVFEFPPPDAHKWHYVLSIYPVLRAFANSMMLSGKKVADAIIAQILDRVQLNLSFIVTEELRPNGWRDIFNGYIDHCGEDNLTSEIREQVLMLVETVTDINVAKYSQMHGDIRQQIMDRARIVTYLAEDNCGDKKHCYDKLCDKILKCSEQLSNDQLSCRIQETLKKEILKPELLSLNGWDCFPGVFILVSKLAKRILNTGKSLKANELALVKIAEGVSAAIKERAEHIAALGGWESFEETFSFVLE